MKFDFHFYDDVFHCGMLGSNFGMNGIQSWKLITVRCSRMVEIVSF